MISNSGLETIGIQKSTVNFPLFASYAPAYGALLRDVYFLIGNL